MRAGKSYLREARALMKTQQGRLELVVVVAVSESPSQIWGDEQLQERPNVHSQLLVLCMV